MKFANCCQYLIPTFPVLFCEFVCVCAVAPIKALCSERFKDWQAKFEPLGLRCCELTGDSQLDDYFELQNAQIVLTTPVRMYTAYLKQSGLGTK